MSLTSSLYTGTSGLTNMGNAMQVIGDNISNVNTVGFKGNRYTFSDLLNQSVATQSGSAQVGRGMALGAVDARFQQGSFESTGNTTDISIGGNGFFVVRQPTTNREYYTRAGNFHFDKEGKLTNPEGYVVQGWKLDEETGEDLGSVTDIIMNSFTSPPKQSSKVQVVTNLDADSESKSVVLANAWDANATPPISPNNYEYQTVIKVYDSLGSTHDVTVYYDKKNGSDWEYIVTVNPGEDKRSLVQGTSSKGLLARGNIAFNESDGTIASMTMEEFEGRIGNVRSQGVNGLDDIHFQIDNTEKMKLDGFDFDLEFDGNTWNFRDQNGDGVITAADKPEGYPNARILFSDNKRIEVALDPDPTIADPDPDFTLRLDTAAVATDALSFDINSPTDMHTQNLSGLSYIGDTANDNTTMQINDPSVMVRDADDISVVWDAKNEKWYWSNPNIQNIEREDYSKITAPGITAATTTRTITNAAAMNQYVDDVQVRWNGTSWDWDVAVPENAQFVSGTGEITAANVAVTVNDPGVFKTAEPSITLDYDGAGGWSFNGGAPAGYPTAVVLATSDENRVELDFNADGAADITYTFNTPLSTTGTPSTLTMEVDPAPPQEYPNATITSVGADEFAIDFDGTGGTDVTYKFAAGVNTDNTFTFDVDPRVKPKDYQNATLKGDKDKVVIDLDGSGGDDNSEDIVFTFSESLKAGPAAKNSTITFDIDGGTSWRNIDTKEMSKDGYFEFSADFLGSSGNIGTDGKFKTSEMKLEFDIGTTFNGVNFVNSSLSTTQFARSSSTTFQSADGYGAGDFEGVNISADGIITGTYSNGQLIPLYRVSLAKFLNNGGLYKEGGNLYRNTRESGEAITGKPGSNGLGSLSPNSLEMSNVDTADEFVKMITTQRGFQANSKIVTTVDEMLTEVINMKR